MTPEQLAEIKARAKTVTQWPHPDDARRTLAREDVPALLAEVERLQDLIKQLRLMAAAGRYDGKPVAVLSSIVLEIDGGEVS